MHAGWDRRESILNEVVTVNGITATAREHAIRAGLSSREVRRRVKARGWALTVACSTPPNATRAYSKASVLEWRGNAYTLAELAMIARVPKARLVHRIGRVGLDAAMRMTADDLRGTCMSGRKSFSRNPESSQNRSVALGGTNEMIRQRIRLGWTRDEAESRPCLGHGGKSRYARDRERREDLAALGIIN